MITADAREPVGEVPWPGWKGRFLRVLFVALLVLFLGDKEWFGPLTRVAWTALIFAAVTDFEGPLGRRWLAMGLLYPVSLGIAALGTVGRVEPGDPWGMFFRYQIWAVWLVDCWLFTPLLLELLGRGRPGVSRWGGVAAGLMMGYALLALASSFGADHVRVSMRQFGTDMGSYAGIFLITFRMVRIAHPVCDRAAWKFVWICAALVVAQALVGLMFVLGGTPAQWLLDMQWVWQLKDQPQMPWRLQFPFDHFNRSGYFAATALFIVLMGLVVARRRAVRTALYVVCGCTLLVIAWTVTRGAFVAALAGLAVIAVMRGSRRSLLIWGPVLAITLAGIWTVLPVQHREQVSRLFDAETWQPGGANSVGARMVLWGYTLEMIKLRPLLGWGYGHENYEQIFADRYEWTQRELGGTSHAHNMWLQTGAESGVPSAVVLFLFCAVRMGLLIAAIIRARGVNHQVHALLVLFLALEVVIGAYGLANYALRLNFGLYTYLVWAVGCGVALRVLERGVEPPRPITQGVVA